MLFDPIHKYRQHANTPTDSKKPKINKDTKRQK